MFLNLFKKKKEKLKKLVPDMLYEDYRKTCIYTGELPLSKEEYSKKFYKNK